MLVTLVAVLGDVGVLPTDPPAAATAAPAATGNGSTTRPAEQATLSDARPDGAVQKAPEITPDIEPNTISALPPDSGTGRRVVFDISEQRVWLVAPDSRAAPDDGVRRTYLVSGSVYDNLQPGTYEVYSRSRHAYGIDDSGTMEYFVRFTRGANAAIGFHSIPTKDGRALQSRAQLGTPLSHGCIRQARPDAIRLWRFAPVGTTVVVTA